MSHIIKDSFYKDRVYQASVTSWGDEGQGSEQQKVKELSKIPMTIETIEKSLGNLGKTAQGPSYSYLSFKSIDQDLYSICGIENFQHLQYVDVSKNNLVSLKALSSLKYMVYLNASHNKLTKFLDLKLKGLIDLLNLRQLKLSDNQIKHIRELQYIENLTYLSQLDLCFNPVQTTRYYRYQVLYHLPGLRVLDGILTKPEEFVKSENLYALDLEERRRIFKEILPEEEFIDRRINIGELIEPETESDNEDDIKFHDKYDKDGNLIESKSQMNYNFKKSMTGSIRSGKSIPNDEQHFRDTQNSHQSLMSETARKLKAMRHGSIDNKQEQQQQNPFYSKQPSQHQVKTLQQEDNEAIQSNNF